MDYRDPEIMAIVFLIPALVGIALVGQGLDEYKEKREWFTLVAGLVFLFAVVFIYLYFIFFRFL